MPRFVIIRYETEPRGVPDQPLISRRLHLGQAVGISCRDGLAADVEVDGLAGIVSAMYRKSSATGTG